MVFHKVAIDVVSKGMDLTQPHNELGQDGMLATPVIIEEPVQPPIVVHLPMEEDTVLITVTALTSHVEESYDDMVTQEIVEEIPQIETTIEPEVLKIEEEEEQVLPVMKKSKEKRLPLPAPKVTVKTKPEKKKTPAVAELIVVKVDEENKDTP